MDLRDRRVPDASLVTDAVDEIGAFLTGVDRDDSLRPDEINGLDVLLDFVCLLGAWASDHDGADRVASSIVDEVERQLAGIERPPR